MPVVATAPDSTLNDNAKARLIAYYLPQFHPIPENDQWWGSGFTEWTNVSRARPLFRGHRQPRLPADLGFYDLRVPETRELQAQMARSCGVEGFCYWHYWFGNGRRILDRPFTDVLASGKPEFPFCLSWANQSWTGIWHGDSKRLLIEQTYPGREDEIAHFEALRPAFDDPRYIRVNNKPLFCVYMPLDLPDREAFVDHWRELAVSAGLPGMFLVATWHDAADPRLGMFDAVTPNGPSDFFGSDRRLKSRIASRLARTSLGTLWNEIYTKRFGSVKRKSYDDLIRHGLRTPEARKLPCIVPNWDNSPRSGRRGVIVTGSTPLKFRQYLDSTIRLIEHRPQNERLLFLKAWNEWAEGNFVEPDVEFGRGYLDAIGISLGVSSL